VGRRPGRPDGCCFHTPDVRGFAAWKSFFKSRQTDVPTRFKQYATAKLNRLEKLDQKAISVDVELSVRRAQPRQSGQKERVELTSGRAARP